MCAIVPVSETPEGGELWDAIPVLTNRFLGRQVKVSITGGPGSSGLGSSVIERLEEVSFRCEADHEPSLRLGLGCGSLTLHAAAHRSTDYGEEDGTGTLVLLNGEARIIIWNLSDQEDVD
jgi:hypothetical protein